MGRIRQRVYNYQEGLFASDLKDVRRGKIGSIRAAAEKHSLKYETLKDHKRGSANRIGGYENQQHLTNAEENALVARIEWVDDYGWPPKLNYVKQMAIGFIKSHGIQKGESKLEKNWIIRFLDRHPSLTSKFATRLDKKKSYASNPVVIHDFFNMVY